MLLGLLVHTQRSSLAQEAAETICCRRHIYCDDPWRPSQCLSHAQTYIRPKASSKELLMVTRITVACFGMLTGVVAIILFVVGTPRPLPPMHACATGHEILGDHLHEHAIALLAVSTRAWQVS